MNGGGGEIMGWENNGVVGVGIKGEGVRVIGWGRGKNVGGCS